MNHSLLMRPAQWQSSSLAHLAGLAAAVTLFAYFSLASLHLAAIEGTRLWLQTEAGYGDSYILYDVNHFKSTGVIYRDLSVPPYLPAQYSPFVYMMYAIPGQNAFGNPFLGPRLVALSAFLCCVGVVLSLVRALVRVRYAWLWGLVLLGSIRNLEEWPLQLRGDFPAVFFNLAALRLMMSRSRYRALWSGLCAGAALQFKFTYVAGLAACFLWLALRKRWQELAFFVPAAVATSAGVYIVLGLREPAMLPQMLSLAPGVADPGGLARILFDVIREPMILFAVAALPAVLASRRPQWLLVLLFAALSFVLQAAADIQAGGNVNYFFEALFALIPLAVMGTFKLISWSRERPALAALVVTAVLIQLMLPLTIEFYRSRKSIGPGAVAASNAEFRRKADFLRGRHTLSLFPRLAILDPRPVLTEPYLMSYLERLGKFDATPILKRIAQREFDIVIARDDGPSWRGVSLIPENLAGPIAASYLRQCSIPPAVFYLPRDREIDSSLIAGFKAMGCAFE